MISKSDVTQAGDKVFINPYEALDLQDACRLVSDFEACDSRYVLK